MKDWTISAWIHLLSAIAWLPITVALFLLHLQGAVAIVLLLSIYANIKTDIGDFHAAVAVERSKDEEQR